MEHEDSEEESEEKESEEEESEEDESEEDLEEDHSEERGKTAKKKRTWKDRYSVPLPSDDEEEDTQEFTQARLLSKMLLRQEMEAKIAMEFDVSVNPDKFVPDEKDNAMIAEFLVKPVLEQSTKWSRFKRKAQDWVKDKNNKNRKRSSLDCNRYIGRLSGYSTHFFQRLLQLGRIPKFSPMSLTPDQPLP